jgi:hypothetical protein
LKRFEIFFGNIKTSTTMRKYLYLFLFIVPACQQSGVEVTRVPKEQPMMAMPDGHNHPHDMGEMPEMATEAPSQSNTTWTLPKGWTNKPASGMRVGSFSGPCSDGSPVDVSVIPLSGAAGGELSNVNRWRDQLGLPPIDESNFKSNTRTVKANGRSYILVHFTNSGKAVMGAFTVAGGQTWFFKMTGSEKAVTENKTAFETFLNSVKIK